MTKEKWDVLVIGGGPAGMMCAGQASARGLRVLLLEKNPDVGQKLSITGGGRCNLTNATFNNRELLKKYAEAEPFLYSAFAQHSVSESLAFFQGLGLETKTEAENRVFPASDKAADVVVVLKNLIAKSGVAVRTGVAVKDILTQNKQIIGVDTTDGVIEARSIVIACGGLSHSYTGSTGDGYTWLKKLGHHLILPKPSLVPITLKNTWGGTLAGTTVNDTDISLYQEQQLLYRTTGKVLFTHDGLSGPGILNLSQKISEALAHGEVSLKLNLLPNISEEELNEHLKAATISHPNKKLKNLIETQLSEKLTSVVLAQGQVDGERTVNTLTRQERHRLIQTIRGFKVEVKGLLGQDKAIVTSGGVDLKEIDFRTMSSLFYPNLYIIGDMLNINRPSGGYSLQLCWTTGYVAGRHC